MPVPQSREPQASESTSTISVVDISLLMHMSPFFQRLTWSDGAPVSFQKLFSNTISFEKQIWPQILKVTDLNVSKREMNISRLIYFHKKYVRQTSLLVSYEKPGASFVGWSRQPLFEAIILERHLNRNKMPFDHTSHTPSEVNLCGLMIMINLARPQWLTVSCTVLHLRKVLCASRDRKHWPSSTELKSLFYSPNHLLRGNTCFFPVWSEQSNAISFCDTNKMTENNFRNITELDFLTESVQLSPVLSNTRSGLVFYHYNEILRLYQATFVAENSQKGYKLCSSPSKGLSVGGNIQKCSTGFFYSILWHCTSQRYGVVSESMVNTNHLSQHGLQTFILENIFGQMCPLKFEWNRTFVSHNFQKLEMVSCDDAMIDPLQMDDLVVDCYPSGEDEPVLDALITQNMKHHCADPNQIPCLFGHSKCFNVSLICTFRTNKDGHILPCNNAAHLRNCRNFQCNMMFKCYENYCVPWEYVCDAKWDCPAGKDEVKSCPIAEECRGGFKCRNIRSVCIHLGQLCDGTQNCPHGDDKHLCDLHDVQCPGGCQCCIYSLVETRGFSTNVLCSVISSCTNMCYSCSNTSSC